MTARQNLTIVLLSIVLVVPTFSLAAGAAGSDVEFEGSGWGHGVGMSQYGAHALAKHGPPGQEPWLYDQILAHYYQGTEIDTVSADTPLWVNLERDFTSLSLTVHPLNEDATSVAVESSGESATAEPGASIDISAVSSDGCLVEVTNPGEPVQSILDESGCSVDFNWYSWNQPAEDPDTKIEIDGCTLADWNAPGGTVFQPCEYARGQLHLRSGSGGLDLSAEMLLNDYVYGISEMPYAWHIEALKVQAVAARGYAQARRVARGDPTVADDNGCWCHVRDTTSDQRYVGWGHTQVAPWISASDATESEILTHPDSNLSMDVITAFYSSSSGGATEFGHLKGFASSPVQWLSSVDDSWAVDGTVWNPNASWTVTKTPQDVADAAGFDQLVSMSVSETRAGSGSVSEVEMEGVVDGQPVTTYKTGTWVRQTFGLKSEYFDVDYQVPPGELFDRPGDEILLYKTNGVFQYNSLNEFGELGPVIHSGSNYTSGWKEVPAIDLDGDGQDEIMFYREDGLYRFYQIGADGRVGSPLQAGSEYTSGWDSIAAVDLDGDGEDEIFFYREDGLYRFYPISATGKIGSPIRAGDEYTTGWTSITAVDLDGDGADEMFFYREDGLYRYYNVRADGSLPSPMLSGPDYPSGWHTITAVDLDGDGQDEMLFYDDDGDYEFYDLLPNGSLVGPIDSGSGLGSGWSVITPINLDGQ